MAKKKEENVAAVETEEMKAKFQEKMKEACRTSGSWKEKEEYSGISGNQRLFQGYESGCREDGGGSGYSGKAQRGCAENCR